MRSAYFLSFCLVFTITLNGQTKLIAHKSHSGNAANFSKAYSQNLFDMPNSNFGEAPRRFVYNVCLDSVEHVSDSVAIMFTSHCNLSGNTAPQQYWKPGADTAKHHHLFSGDYSMEEIKWELKNEYYFENDIETVKFIGFEGYREKKNSVLPIVPTSPNNQTPFGNQPLILIVGLLSLSAFAGWLSHRFQVRSIS